ncbi:PAS domain-containing protein (plasmid) [Skermanella rosea]|uniref:PAS domain-containing protein n=1 Tax=Skermanella rosea TaxID=1817965 RepID=UPI001931B886|nr:PAS domain-containing protein [Skermanella rosea]UEM06844.1 PAS domain-containing protein [Skermanella rosea]
MTCDRNPLPPVISAAFDYWKSKLDGRLMPARRDLNPCQIPSLLPYLILTDVCRDPPDFRYRLIGTQVVAQACRDYTGMRFSQLDHTGPGSTVWQDRIRVVETRRPVLTTPPYHGPKAGIAGVSGIHLPLSSDGDTVDMILTAVAFTPVLKTLG